MDELLNNAPCGFLVFADDGSIIEANATLIDSLGYERGELLKLHVEKIFSVAGRIFYQTHFFPLLKLQERADEIFMTFMTTDKQEIPVLLNAQRVCEFGVYSRSAIGFLERSFRPRTQRP